MADLGASAILNIPHLKVFLDIVRDQVAALEIDKVLIYMIDLVDESALVWLAQQFDILGYKGWFLAITEQEKRDLLKRAIELHRFKGTPFSIKQALEQFGFPNAEIIEGVGTLAFYDGVFNHSGAIQYGDQGHWAYFQVLFNLLDFTTAIPPGQVEIVRELILEYKNARSHLFNNAVIFTADLQDTVTITEQLDINIIMNLNDAVAYLYDGTFDHDGSINHQGIDDSDINITII